MGHDEFRTLMEQGDTEGIRSALAEDPGLATRTIHWVLNQENESDPLHYVSDCVGQGRLVNGAEGEIAKLLLAHGAAIDGSGGRESPLIAAASLGAAPVARVLVEGGADLELTSIFGSRALHWAAWTGTPEVVDQLIAHGADIEATCTEFGATPLFWAVHGYGPDGPAEKSEQVAAAARLIGAGARVDIANKHGLTAMELARRGKTMALYELLQQSEARAE